MEKKHELHIGEDVYKSTLAMQEPSMGFYALDEDKDKDAISERIGFNKAHAEGRRLLHVEEYESKKDENGIIIGFFGDRDPAFFTVILYTLLSQYDQKTLNAILAHYNERVQEKYGSDKERAMERQILTGDMAYDVMKDIVEEQVALAVEDMPKLKRSLNTLEMLNGHIAKQRDEAEKKVEELNKRLYELTEGKEGELPADTEQ